MSYTFRVNVSLGAATGTIDVTFSNEDELDLELRQLEEMGFAYNATAGAQDKRRLCPTHRIELEASRRKPGFLFCKHKEDGVYCRYEEKE